MMTIEGYFEADVIVSALPILRLSESQPEYRPTHFASSERKPPAANRIADEERYRSFLQRNASGFFLYADRCRYSVITEFLSGYGTVSVEPRGRDFDDNEGRSVFAAIARMGAMFSYACQVDEYYRRHRFVTQIGASVFETWVGRDLGKYLPGFYWLTGVSDSIAHRLRLPPFEDILPNARHVLSSAGRRMIEMPWPSQEWRASAPMVDNLLEGVPGIFPMAAVHAELAGAADLAALMNIDLQWR